MDRLKETLYDILGVSRDAKLTDIGRAYNRHKAAMRAETTPPDARRTALLHEAFEILSDPQKRAAYDASLRRNRTVQLPGGRSVSRRAAGAVLGLVALGVLAAYWFLDRPAADKASRLVTEIQTAASLAVARVQSIDLSGKAAPIGIAFTIEEGVMITPCAGISPNAQLVVNVPPRQVPARVIGADAQRRFCRLEVVGAGSWPLTLRSVPPRAGDKVYAADIAANGEVMLREGTVKGSRLGLQGSIVDASLPVPPGAGGRPLLDSDGRVIAVAMIGEDGKGHHLGVPSDWLEAPRQRAAPAAPPAAASPEPEAVAPGTRPGGGPANITPERRERLEKAFRPPPTVPGDI